MWIIFIGYRKKLEEEMKEVQTTRKFNVTSQGHFSHTNINIRSPIASVHTTNNNLLLRNDDHYHHHRQHRLEKVKKNYQSKRICFT